MKLAEESSSLSSAEDETSTIAAEPMNAATPNVKPTTRACRPIQRDIVIREPIPQEQQATQAEAKTLDDEEDPEYKRTGKKKLRKAPAEPSRDSTPTSEESHKRSF